MIVGTAGHIDHGKTALVRALTGVDADRLAVMAALCTYADEAGFCEPSQATLARRLSRSRPWAAVIEEPPE